MFTEVNWLKLRYILHIMIWYSPCSQKMLYVLSIFLYARLTPFQKIAVHTHLTTGLTARAWLGARRVGDSGREANLRDRISQTHCILHSSMYDLPIHVPNFNHSLFLHVIKLSFYSHIFKVKTSLGATCSLFPGQ